MSQREQKQKRRKLTTDPRRNQEAISALTTKKRKAVWAQDRASRKPGVNSRTSTNTTSEYKEKWTPTQDEPKWPSWPESPKRKERARSNTQRTECRPWIETPGKSYQQIQRGDGHRPKTRHPIGGAARIVKHKTNENQSSEGKQKRMEAKSTTRTKRMPSSTQGWSRANQTRRRKTQSQNRPQTKTKRLSKPTVLHRVTVRQSNSPRPIGRIWEMTCSVGCYLVQCMRESGALGLWNSKLSHGNSCDCQWNEILERLSHKTWNLSELYFVSKNQLTMYSPSVRW